MTVIVVLSKCLVFILMANLVICLLVDESEDALISGVQSSGYDTGYG